MKTLVLMLGVSVVSLGSWSDAITVDRRRYEGIYIRETATHYYLCSPRDGSVTSESRGEGRISGFSRSEDSEQLRERWLAKQGPGEEDVVSAPTPVPVRVSPPDRPAESTAPTLTIKGNAKRDPAREDAKLQYVLAERARQAYLRAERQRAWEAERHRQEELAYQEYMRDLQLREQQLRVENLAGENAHRDRLRRPAFGYIIESPWRQTYGLGRYLRDRNQAADPDAGETAEEARPDASADSIRQRHRTNRKPPAEDSATAQTP